MREFACPPLAIPVRPRYERANQRGRKRVSQSDSFINEVTEEVRRDRLYRLARRYGWIVVLVLVVVVGGAGFVEWRKAQARNAAQELGSAVFAALETGSAASRAAALSSIETDAGPAAALVDMMAASEYAQTDPSRAGALLDGVSGNADLPRVYRDIALLKLVMLRDYPMFSEEKLARLEPLTEPGAPFRLLAMEQMALLHMDNGETAAALDLLRPIVTDAEASRAQRQRAQQLVVVLGGDTEGA